MVDGVYIMIKQPEIFPDPLALGEAAAEVFAWLAVEAAVQRGVFHVALAGGSTPRRLYERLAQSDYGRTLPWRRIQIYWSDERCVPPAHPESNYRLAQQALLAHIAIPPENIHRIAGEYSPAQSADLYIQELRQQFDTPLPTFDLMLLGLGNDGHTASLFPGSPALEEKSRWVAAVEHRYPPLPMVDRITLTLPVINAARSVIFMVSGKSKREILRRVFSEPVGDPLPAQQVQPTSGDLRWLVDEDAVK